MALGPGTEAARRCLMALAFVACFLAIGIYAAITASGSPLLPAAEACCVLPIAPVVILELRPAIVALRAGRVATRRFREELDALPETSHPLDQTARPRPRR